MLWALLSSALAQPNPAACLSLKPVHLGADIGEVVNRLHIEAEVTNGCTERIEAFGGYLRVQQLGGQMATTIYLYTHRLRVKQGATEPVGWYIHVGGAPADLWLMGSPLKSLAFQWTPSTVVLTDGQVLLNPEEIKADIAQADTPKP